MWAGSAPMVLLVLGVFDVLWVGMRRRQAYQHSQQETVILPSMSRVGCVAGPPTFCVVPP